MNLGDKFTELRTGRRQSLERTIIEHDFAPSEIVLGWQHIPQTRLVFE
jgi:hypothetical protein